MKKLMFAVAALAAGVACAEITSANIVGYTTTVLQDGATAMGPAFLTIGAEGCKLTTIKPTNLPSDYKAKINIQTLTAFGEMETKYVYHFGETGRGAKADGWYVGDKTLVTAENDVVFAPGSGLWVSGLPEAGLQSAGQVITEDVTVELRDGATMVANPYPVAIKLTSLVPANLPSDYKAKINIQTLTAFGEMETKYVYHFGETGRGAKADGWYVGDKTLVTAENDVEFAGGAGLWVSGLPGVTITFSFPKTESAE